MHSLIPLTYADWHIIANLVQAQSRAQLMIPECNTLQSSSTAATKLLLKLTLNLPSSALSKPCPGTKSFQHTIHYVKIHWLPYSMKRLCSNELSCTTLFGHGLLELRFKLKIRFPWEEYQQHLNHRSVLIWLSIGSTYHIR